MENDNSKAATNLRQRSLLFWLDLSQKKPKTTARLYENTVLQGNFQATDAMETKFRFDNWESPVGIYDHVVIRGTDIRVLEIEHSKGEAASL
ncbi:10291_t:CDS:2 [Gigaspora margarita]|uniref:Gem-associated protein 7-like n=2 Tax=Gigaspora margarita TaxID=4874 RepID=A0A8H4A0E6_GIGMA|nr:gem-associated protein 7-like [Gigaspora margarita]CAG8781591.1 10291_t:CDS:2 [Gigaspora margarita]